MLLWLLLPSNADDLFSGPVAIGVLQVNFGLFQGTKPLLVVADPNPGSGEMKQAMYELNTRMPRKVGCLSNNVVRVK